MALIELHPEVDNYILQLSLQEISARGGVADLVENGNIVIIRDFRVDLGGGIFDHLARSTGAIEDPAIRRHLKKLESTTFFEGERPRRRWRRTEFHDPVKQALFTTLCKGDAVLFERAAAALRAAHEDALRAYETCFAGYRSNRLVPSVRLTRTLFENLHWDEHWIEGDFHTARVFANLDSRPRIWHLSHRFPDMMKRMYREHRLERFAGKDPNELLSYINSNVLGGLSDKWKDDLPRHRIAFEPGEVWVGESRLVSHQIYYGEAALVYMWLVDAKSMVNEGNRFNAQVERVHVEMRELGLAPVATRSG
jgi:hypothetical protein